MSRTHIIPPGFSLRRRSETSSVPRTSLRSSQSENTSPIPCRCLLIYSSVFLGLPWQQWSCRTRCTIADSIPTVTWLLVLLSTWLVCRCNHVTLDLCWYCEVGSTSMCIFCLNISLALGQWLRQVWFQVKDRVSIKVRVRARFRVSVMLRFRFTVTDCRDLTFAIFRYRLPGWKTRCKL